MPVDAGLIDGGGAAALFGIGATRGSSVGALGRCDDLDSSCCFSCCRGLARARFRDDIAFVRSLFESQFSPFHATATDRLVCLRFDLPSFHASLVCKVSAVIPESYDNLSEIIVELPPNV